MNETLIIWYKDDWGNPYILVTATVKPPYTVGGLLDHYAKDYVFDRKKLSGSIVSVIDLTDIHR